MKPMAEAFDQIAAWVIAEAQRRGYVGVFAMTEFETGMIRWVKTGENVLKLDRPDGKEDTNSLGMVLAKLAVVIAHLRHSGGKALRGEVPHPGGRISADGRFGYAFSGAKSEEDDQLMQDAEGFHRSL